MKEKFIIILASIIIIPIIILSYWSERKINYSLMYKDMVKQTITEMVKKECLK